MEILGISVGSLFGGGGAGKNGIILLVGAKFLPTRSFERVAWKRLY
jgi:hypothetical protein